MRLSLLFLRYYFISSFVSTLRMQCVHLVEISTIAASLQLAQVERKDHMNTCFFSLMRKLIKRFRGEGGDDKKVVNRKRAVIFRKRMFSVPVEQIDTTYAPVCRCLNHCIQALHTCTRTRTFS